MIYMYSKRATLSRCNMQTRNIVLTVQKQSFVHNCTPSLHVLITYEFLHDMNYNYSNNKITSLKRENSNTYPVIYTNMT